MKAKKAKDQPRFDVDTVRELAGGKVFARGEDYFTEGHVEILVRDRARVLARVAGTEDYRTELTGRGKKIGGECSCPAFEDWGFCKHMVAVALAANSAGGDVEAEGSGTLARIRDHLREQGVDALVDLIVGLAERDPALFHKLEMAAALVHADDKTLEGRLCKAIDKAIHTRHFIDYGEASDWAAGVDEALDTIAGLVPNGRAVLALKLVERAIERIEQSLESIDDSDGHCGTLLYRAREIHLAAVRVVRPDPVQLARDLFTREMQGDHDGFEGAVTAYADVLGEIGLAEYRRLATEAWEKLPARTGKIQSRDELSYSNYPLRKILDFFAEREGDLDARIALRGKFLTSPWSYLELAEFCLAHGCKDEALRRAEEGLWVFEDDQQDTRLVLFTAGLLSKAGRKVDAQAHVWRAFEKAPSLELYKSLRALAGGSARERAVQCLEAKLIEGARIRWHSLSDILIQVLMREKAMDAAWAAVRKHQASMATKLTLADASEKTHPAEALSVYAERVDQLANGGGDHAYKEAAQLVVRMASLRNAAEQASYVAALKERFGRRRNFMKLVG